MSHDLKALLTAFGNLIIGSYDPSSHEFLRRWIEESVDHAAARDRGVEEGTIGLSGLGTEGRIHHDGIEGLVESVDGPPEPFHLDSGPGRVATGNREGFRIRIDPQHSISAQEFRGDREDPIPATQVCDGTTGDVAASRREVDELGRDPRGRRILFRGRYRMGDRVERL